MSTIDLTDVLILKDHYSGSPTIADLRKTTNLAASTIHNRLKKLEAEGLITAPSQKGNARDRKITELGKNYLHVNGYVAKQVFDETRFG